MLRIGIPSLFLATSTFPANGFGCMYEDLLKFTEETSLRCSQHITYKGAFTVTSVPMDRLLQVEVHHTLEDHHKLEDHLDHTLHSRKAATQKCIGVVVVAAFHRSRRSHGGGDSCDDAYDDTCT